MSRTTLCCFTAGSLTLVALFTMGVRYFVLGDEVDLPAGPNTYHVQIKAKGNTNGDARLLMVCPLDFNRQHIFNEKHHSDMLKPRTIESRKEDRRLVQWSPRVLGRDGPFEAVYEFYCNVNVSHPTNSMAKLGKSLRSAPKGRQYLGAEPRIDPSHPLIHEVALELTADVTRSVDQARKLFQYVEQSIDSLKNPETNPQSATSCLKAGQGDAAGRCRLFVALCRNRGIPARMVAGLNLENSNTKREHVWAEAWVGDHWISVCPVGHFCGRVPSNYLVFCYGDMALCKGFGINDLEFLWEIENHNSAQSARRASLVRRFFQTISLFNLPPSQAGLVEFLLHLPLATLIICVYRNVIGFQSFGTFTPALIGLVFRSVESIPGIVILLVIILLGWGMRRVLDKYNLLQVPRMAFLLSLVVVLLLTGLIVTNQFHIANASYISLFPLVILTSMIERFWTLETEDGAISSFKTLMGTFIMAGTVSFVVSMPSVGIHLFRYPETLLIIMAAQLLLGRYTGYRLAEIFRFRDFWRQREMEVLNYEIEEEYVLSHERVTIPMDDFHRRRIS